MAGVGGLLLAAGAGRRYGRPKALVVTDGRPWVLRTVDAMRMAGCDPLLVVIGAAADEVRKQLPADLIVMENPDWATGLGSSLRVGLEAAALDGVEAVLVMLVDLPRIGADHLIRMLAAVDRLPLPAVLAQADYDGSPGHPVLLGRDHWLPIIESTQGDFGARDYLRAQHATPVRLGAAADGADCDRPASASG